MHTQIRSTEILKLLAQQTDNYLLDELGAPHRDDLKVRTMTVKTADGRDLVVFGGAEGGKILDDFLRAGLVYEAVPLDDEYRRIYRLTPDGLKRGKANA
jgi:hypothetical protein